MRYKRQGIVFLPGATLRGHSCAAGGMEAAAAGRRRVLESARALLGLHAAFAAVAVAAIAGTVLSVGILAAPTAREPEIRSDIGRVVTTSFGVMSVDHAVWLRGAAARQIAQRAGERAYGEDGLQVAVTLTNLRGRRLALSQRQLRLRIAGGPAQSAVLASTWPGWVDPQSAKKALFRFAAPRGDELLWVEFRDPGRRAPIVLALGRAEALGPEISITEHKDH